MIVPLLVLILGAILFPGFFRALFIGTALFILWAVVR